MTKAAPETTGEQQVKREDRKSVAVASKEDGWPLKGMSEGQVREAKSIRARIDDRRRRPVLEITGDDDGPKRLVVGTGSEADKVLHSMRVFDALGSRSNGFVDEALNQLAQTVKATGDEERDSAALTAAAALVAAVEPRNELEATMALQMVAANSVVLDAFAKSRNAQFMEQATAYSNMANKAMRSFALHAEAIAKLRRGGEQVVRHVHVNDGGQAVIAGTVHTGGGQSA